MRNRIIKVLMAIAVIACSNAAYAQFNLKKAVGSAAKAAQAFTLTDQQMAAYVRSTSMVKYVRKATS